MAGRGEFGEGFWFIFMGGVFWVEGYGKGYKNDLVVQICCFFCVRKCQDKFRLLIGRDCLISVGRGLVVI